ncbi:MAG: hypothetical protein K1W17_03875, partial [Oscillospiraceae bacterium]
TRTGKTPFKADSSLFIIVCPFGVGNTGNIYSHMLQEARAKNAEVISSALSFDSSHKLTDKDQTKTKI